MRERHLALIADNDPKAAKQLQDLLKPLGFDSVVYDNHAEALEAARTQHFCLVLLDLRIRAGRGSGETEPKHGRSLLAKLRAQFPEHNGRGHLLPIVVVGGSALVFESTLDLMKTGASDVLGESQPLAEAVLDCLARSGRTSHQECVTIVEVLSLREELKAQLGNVDHLFEFDAQGHYQLSSNVVIGDVNTQALEELGNPEITKLARELEHARGSKKRRTGRN